MNKSSEICTMIEEDEIPFTEYTEHLNKNYEVMLMCNKNALQITLNKFDENFKICSKHMFIFSVDIMQRSIQMGKLFDGSIWKVYQFLKVASNYQIKDEKMILNIQKYDEDNQRMVLYKPTIQLNKYQENRQYKLDIESMRIKILYKYNQKFQDLQKKYEMLASKQKKDEQSKKNEKIIQKANKQEKKMNEANLIFFPLMIFLFLFVVLFNNSGIVSKTEINLSNEILELQTRMQKIQLNLNKKDDVLLKQEQKEEKKPNTTIEEQQKIISTPEQKLNKISKKYDQILRTTQTLRLKNQQLENQISMIIPFDLKFWKSENFMIKNNVAKYTGATNYWNQLILNQQIEKNKKTIVLFEILHSFNGSLSFGLVNSVYCSQKTATQFDRSFVYMNSQIWDSGEIIDYRPDRKLKTGDKVKMVVEPYRNQIQWFVNEKLQGTLENKKLSEPYTKYKVSMEMKDRNDKVRVLSQLEAV